MQNIKHKIIGATCLFSLLSLISRQTYANDLNKVTTLDQATTIIRVNKILKTSETIENYMKNHSDKFDDINKKILKSLKEQVEKLEKRDVLKQPTLSFNEFLQDFTKNFDLVVNLNEIDQVSTGKLNDGLKTKVNTTLSENNIGDIIFFKNFKNNDNILQGLFLGNNKVLYIEHNLLKITNLEHQNGYAKYVSGFKLDIKKLLKAKEEAEKKAREEAEKKAKEEAEKKAKEEVETKNSEALYSLKTFMFRGVIHWNGYKYTYYSQRVLPGPGLKIPGRHVSEDGYVCDGDGYIVLAGSAPKGTVYPTPFGRQGKIYDRGTYGNHLDVYIR